MATTNTATPVKPFKPTRVQTSVLRNLSALGASTTDYHAIVKDGGNGMTIVRLAELGYIKIKPVSKKQTEKGYELSALGKKLVAKFADKA